MARVTAVFTSEELLDPGYVTVRESRECGLSSRKGPLTLRSGQESCDRSDAGAVVCPVPSADIHYSSNPCSNLRPPAPFKPTHGANGKVTKQLVRLAGLVKVAIDPPLRKRRPNSPLLSRTDEREKTITT
jgi:hypothetical protein